MVKYSKNPYVRKSQYESFGMSDVQGYGHSISEQEKKKKSNRGTGVSRHWF
jgi:hypothetical protein